MAAVTYEQPNLLFNINGHVYTGVNTVTVADKADKEISSVTTDGHPSSRRTGEPRSDWAVTFGQALTEGDRLALRGLIGKHFTISVKDPSGTADNVTGTEAFFQRDPDFSRANADVEFQLKIDSLFTNFGG